jgi:hypothetical protein
MNPNVEHIMAERRVRWARAERLGPHLAELELLNRRRDRGLAIRTLRRHFGAALVAVGTRLQGAERASRAAAAVPSPGTGC